MTETRFSGRDAGLPRQERSEGEVATDLPAETLNPLIRSITGASIEEIERLLLELQRVFAPMASTNGEAHS